MNVGFHYARYAADPLGKEGTVFPWCQVVQVTSGEEGSRLERVVYDFIRYPAAATAIAQSEDLKRPKDELLARAIAASKRVPSNYADAGDFPRRIA